MEKNYLRFQLDPQKLLLTWFILIGLILAPYAFMLMQLTSWDSTEYPVHREMFLVVPIYGILVGIGYALFYFRLMSQLIGGLGYKDYDLGFHGNFWDFIGTLVGGMILTVVTLGFYVPWFIRNLMVFFTNNSSYAGEYFEFKGRGADLFRIFLVWVILPIFAMVIVIAVVFGTSGITMPDGGPISGHSPLLLGFQLVINMVFYFILIPFFYFSYKWRTRIGWQNYNLNLSSKFTESAIFIAIQMFLSFITLGIYLPMGIIKLYNYFVNRIQFESETHYLKFGYEANLMEEYKFLFIQLILIIVTLGIYYPWAIHKIGGRFIGATYTQKNPYPTELDFYPEPTQPDPVLS